MARVVPRRAPAHLVACIAFGATLLQSYTTWMFTVHPLKTQVALLVSLVSGASTVLYGAKFAGAVTILEAATPGTFCMPLRYLQWGFSTGCLICMLGALSPEGPRARAVLRRTLAINAAMMTCACLERLLPAPANLGAFAAGGACFVANLRGQYELFRLAAMTLMLPADRVALAALQRMTTLTWILFPLTRAAALGGVLGRNAEEVAFCVCDFAAKFGYATFLLAGTFSIASKD